MSTAIDQVLDLIGNMTVLELSELKKRYEDKFGVTAAAPMMARSSRRPAPGPRPGNVEKSLCITSPGMRAAPR